MKEENLIVEKSMAFAIRIVKLYQYLRQEKTEYVLSKQLLKSGTSVGANVREAVRAQTRNDFISKMNIALKEISESEYWLELLYKTDYINAREFESIHQDCKTITKLLMSIVKTTKENS